MNNDTLNGLYAKVLPDLMQWVRNNDKLSGHITQHDLKYLFEFNGIRGLSIDLGRFSPEYYNRVFDGVGNKKHIDVFVARICLVMKQSFERLGRQEVNLTIHIRHKISTVTYWKTYYITPSFTGRESNAMQLKEE